MKKLLSIAAVAALVLTGCNKDLKGHIYGWGQDYPERCEDHGKRYQETGNHSEKG